MSVVLASRRSPVTLDTLVGCHGSEGHVETAIHGFCSIILEGESTTSSDRSRRNLCMLIIHDGIEILYNFFLGGWFRFGFCWLSLNFMR